MLDLTKFGDNLHMNALKRSESFREVQKVLTHMEVVEIDGRWYVKAINRHNQERFYRKSYPTKAGASIVLAAYSQLWNRRLANKEVDLEREFVHSTTLVESENGNDRISKSSNGSN